LTRFISNIFASLADRSRRALNNLELEIDAGN
jgi:hypothetical protein